MIRDVSGARTVVTGGSGLIGGPTVALPSRLGAQVTRSSTGRIRPHSESGPSSEIVAMPPSSAPWPKGQTRLSTSIVHALRYDTPPAPGILVAAPLTYLVEDTADAVRAVLPDTPIGELIGREVGLDLRRARTLLRFQPRVLLDDIGPGLLASTIDDRP